MEGESGRYLKLLKLSNLKSQEAVEHLLTTLWDTRKTGLSASQKSHLRSLLNLPSPAELGPVVACLRSLIRKSVHDSADILNLLPPDLSLDLRGILLFLLQKYQNQWKEDLLSEQVERVVPPCLPSLSCSEISTAPCSRQDNLIARTSHRNLASMRSCFTPSRLQDDFSAFDNLGIVPHLKSMSWTMEDQRLASASRVAVISLKLQDYTKSPFGQREVKFLLSKDALEAMLRSMTSIGEQLSIIVGSPSRPSQKQQK